MSRLRGLSRTLFGSTSWNGISLAAVALTGLLAFEGAAQDRKLVFQFHLIGAAATPDYGGVGMGLYRRAAGRLSYGATATAGTSAGRFTLRTEGMLLFNLDPGRQSGVAPYGGGGVVWRLVDDQSAGFLLILVGIESAPASSSGWFVELGVGAGLRGAVGWRTRR
jgi:opacity protein-like surface antigen